MSPTTDGPGEPRRAEHPDPAPSDAEPSDAAPSDTAPRDPEPRAPSASRTVLGRGAVYTLASAGPALAAVAVLPAVTRLLRRPEYDLVAVGTVVVQVGYVLVALGLGAAITRHYLLERTGAAGARRLVLQGAGIAAVLTAVAAATGPLWAPLVLGRELGVELLLAVVACAGGAAMVLAQAYLRGADRAAPFVLLAVLASLVGPVSGLGAVLAVEPSARAYLAGVAAGFLAAGSLGLLLVARSAGDDGAGVAPGSAGVAAAGAGAAPPSAPLAAPLAGTPAGRAPGLRAALRVGLPTVPHQVGLYLALAGLVVVADRLLDAGGPANVALTIGAGATVVTAGLNNAWAPLVYRTAPEDRGRVLTETTRTVATVTVVLAGMVALLSPWVLRIAAPADRFGTDALVPAVALACAAAVPSVLYLASGHLVFARGRTGGLAVTTPLAVAAGLATAAALTGRLDVVAVGVGYLVTYLALAVGTTALQRGVAEHPWWPPALPGIAVLWIAATAAGGWAPVTGALGAGVRVAGAVLLVAAGLLLLRRHRA